MAPTTPAGGVGGSIPPAGPVSSPVQPGDILAGKFRVERVLGAGGMGVVVAARHTQLEQRVALKFLLPVACEVPGAVARFLREGKAAARITSEHVARVTDTGMLDGGAPYLVMEYLEGSDLGAHTRDRGPVSADDAVEYVLQACEAVVEAHALGIIHRDLKPANLFLTRRADGSPLVKVLDFGISKVEGAGSQSQLTSASVLMGSPRYMSPEQMLSAKDVDVRADVWALGVILFELVTGKPVWEADTVQGLCALIASAPAPLLRAVRPDAPAMLEDVIARCLAKSRHDRLANVAELALALEPLASKSAQRSVDRILRVAGRRRSISTAPPPSTPPRPRIGVVVAAVALAVVVAGVALSAVVVARRDIAAAPPPSASIHVEPSVASSTTPIVTPPNAPSAEAAPAASPSVAAPPRAPVVVRVDTAAGSSKPRNAGAKSVSPSAEPNRALTDRK